MRRSGLSSGEWGAVFRRQRSSGLTVRAFCQRAGVALSTFSYWRRKLRDRSRVSGRQRRFRFAEVKVVREGAGVQDAGSNGVTEESEGIELHLGRGRRIVVRPGFDRRTLLDLVEALEAGLPQGAAVR
jgi:transposase-like protein